MGSALLLMGAGDPEAGRQVVLRQTSTCVLCHAVPGGVPHLMGTVGPSLDGVGARRDEAGIRAQIENAGEGVMPRFGAVGGARVGTAWQGRPILSQREIDDAAAYLATLK